MTRLSQLFDAAEHELTPGEHFTNAPLVLLSFEQGEDEEPLDPYETPTQVAMTQDTGGSYRVLPDAEFAQGWGSLALCLSALARMLGGRNEQFQHNLYDAKNRFVSSYFTFRYKPDDTDYDAYQGQERL